jgi:biopolymer transport protein ExbB
MQILQITTNAADTLSTAGGESAVSVLELLTKGGSIIAILAILSIVAVYIFVERYRTIQGAAKTPERFMEEIREKVTKGDVEGAKMQCAHVDSPIARMIEKGVSRIGSPLKNIEASIENVGKIEVYILEKNLPILATIAGAAPMLGFLGTVIGMIRAFIAIAQEEGSVSPKLLSQGIYEAMITTAAGLVVGILAYLAYNFLVTRVQKIIHKMEYNSIEFIDLLQEPQ